MRNTLTLATLLFSLIPLTAMGQISADLIAIEGDVSGNSTIALINAPFVNGLGQVGFNAILADKSASVVFDGAEVFNTTSLVPTTENVSIRSPMGVGNAGQFVFNPNLGSSVSAVESIRIQSGEVLGEGNQAPGFATGFNITFVNGATMTDDGTSYWIAGITNGAGGEGTASRALYRRNLDGSIDRVITAGDAIGSETVSTRTFGVDYQFSRDNANSIIEVNADTTDGTDDGRVLVNLSVVAAQAAPAPDASANPLVTNWDFFDRFTINNAGNYVFSGDTDGSNDTDEFIAYNGVIQLREGDSIAGITLDGSIRGVQLNENNSLALVWDADDGTDVLQSLFFASDAADLSNLTVVASVGDEIDVDGDGIADWTLNFFQTGSSNGSSIALSEDGTIYVTVDLRSIDGGTFAQAIIGIDGSSSFALGDVNRDGIVDFSDIAPFIRVLAADAFQLEADIDRNGVVDFDDIAPFIIILSS
ncbi:hypothetical protein N9Y42_09560 [Mariniblastus sp.]|nr:hypothetical protein [Mariniblastus sp.]